MLPEFNTAFAEIFSGFPACECGSLEFRVIDCRSTLSGFRRRRQCNKCGLRITTIEVGLQGTSQGAKAGDLLYRRMRRLFVKMVEVSILPDLRKGLTEPEVIGEARLTRRRERADG